MSFPIRKITADQQDEFLKTMSVPFGTDPSPAWIAQFQITLVQADLCSAFDGDRMVSTFGSYDLQLTVPGGALVPMAGTTVVTVLPTHRRQGILRAHMAEHFREARERGQILAGLWASESSIYGRFGYGPGAERFQITLPKPHARLKNPADIRGTMRLLELDEALALFPGVYDRAVQNRPGMFVRTPDWWKLRNLADPEEHRRGATSHRRVLYEKNGEPAGYAIYRTKTDYTTYTTELLLIELIGQNPEAEHALWQFLFGVDLVSTIKHWNLPVDDPILWWLEQPREMQRQPSDSIWIRLIDVAEALNRRHYAAPGRIVFRFRDELCPENEGIFTLESGADGFGRCERSAKPPELELTPFTLGAVYLGGHRVGELARAGLIGGSSDALRRADAMLSWDPKPWCQEIF